MCSTPLRFPSPNLSKGESAICLSACLSLSLCSTNIRIWHHATAAGTTDFRTWFNAGGTMDDSPQWPFCCSWLLPNLPDKPCFYQSTSTIDASAASLHNCILEGAHHCNPYLIAPSKNPKRKPSCMMAFVQHFQKKVLLMDNTPIPSWYQKCPTTMYIIMHIYICIYVCTFVSNMCADLKIIYLIIFADFSPSTMSTIWPELCLPTAQEHQVTQIKMCIGRKWINGS